MGECRAMALLAGFWQGGPLMPNDQNEPRMETHFYVAVLSSRTPPRTNPPGAVWRCSGLPLPWPGGPCELRLL